MIISRHWCRNIPSWKRNVSIRRHIFVPWDAYKIALPVIVGLHIRRLQTGKKIKRHGRSTSATDIYKTRKAEYDAYIDAKVRAGSSLFAGLPKRRGWASDGSVCTDGVSVSLQYSTDVVVDEGAGKGWKKPAKNVAEPSEEYEKNLSTLIVGKGEGSKHTIVAGIDPGRANLATIAYVLDERTGKHFSNAASRSQ